MSWVLGILFWVCVWWGVFGEVEVVIVDDGCFLWLFVMVVFEFGFVLWVVE